MNALLSSLARLCPWSAVDVLNHLWQSTVVAFAIWLVVLLCRGLSARTRWVLGWIALAKFALPAGLCTYAVHWTGWGSPRWLAADLPGAPLTLPAFAVSATREATGNGVSVATMLGAIWLVGFGAIWGWWIVRSIAVRRRLLAQARPINSALGQRVNAATARIGLKRAPYCVQVPTPHGPGLLGLVSPIVILPPALEKTLTPVELESVLLHELVHLRRGDNAWAAASALVSAVLWFHPLVWILTRRLALETEQSCDERVLEITGDPDTYAESIVKSVQHSLGLYQPCFAGAATRPVISRIKNILGHRNRPKRRIARTAALSGGVLLVALSGRAGSFSAAEERVAPVATSNTDERAVTEAKPAAPAPIAIPQPQASITPAPEAPVPLIPSEAQAPSIAPETRSLAVKPVLPEAADVPAPMANPSVRVDPSTPIVTAGTMVSTESVPAPVATPAPSAPSAPLSAERAEAAPKERDVPGSQVSVYDISALDRAPVVRSRQPPMYPFAMRRMGISGQVIVDFIVDQNGDVRNAYAARSTRPDFESPAVEAVRHWKFKPGQVAGRNASTRMQVPIVFTLNDR